MAGHSKWANIQYKKGANDQKRSKIFQKLRKEIYVAAKDTNGVIEDNPALRLAVDKAKALNMPKDIYEKAIKKAVSGKDSENYEEILYEGYSKEGVAIMVFCLSDNKNRTAGMVRAAFTKFGGNLGTDGSVSYLFKRKGLLSFKKDYLDYDKVVDVAILNGGLDTLEEDGYYFVFTEPEDFIKLEESYISEGVDKFEIAEISFIPDNYMELSNEDEEEFNKLIEELEEIDDVQNVYHNLK